MSIRIFICFATDIFGHARSRPNRVLSKSGYRERIVIENEKLYTHDSPILLKLNDKSVILEMKNTCQDIK